LLQDVETERSVTDTLEAVGQGVTCLIIAHRLSTVRRADSIVVISEGQVAEQGSHAELMRLGGVYHGLVTAAEVKGLDSWDEPAPDASMEGEQQVATAAL
jgi:ABC-type multidrug transport system fused ATPase/permease subunit